MRLEGRLWKSGEHWLIEVPALAAMTQGKTKAEAYEMIGDLIATMANNPELEVTVEPAGSEAFTISANRTGILVALLLRRQRERQGITLAEAAARLNQTSRNAYARYEQGQSVPTLEKLEELLQAVAPDQQLVLRLAA